MEKLWLVWHVSDRWTLLQQRLIQEVGWTPLIGRDPRATAPPLRSGSIYIDFNLDLGLERLWMHFPLELAFRFVPHRIAFWHSDLVCGMPVMRDLANRFAALPDGAMAAVHSSGGRRNALFPWRQRLWELVGCTTRGASRDQFDKGTGWWMNFQAHPNTPAGFERVLRQPFYWDHGSGVWYWHLRYGRRAVTIPERMVAPGHCTSIGRRDYTFEADTANRNLAVDLDRNYQLEAVAKRLDIEHLL